jgi:hypothetical protein
MNERQPEVEAPAGRIEHVYGCSGDFRSDTIAGQYYDTHEYSLMNLG